MKNFYYKISIIFLLVNVSFAQRVAVHSLTDFTINTSTNKFSFDIYSQSTGVNSIRVGLTSYYINFNNAALNSPVLSNINPKYTSGSTTGDYDAMTAQVALGKIAVSILFTGNGDGTGDLLSTTGPLGEHICTLILNIDNQNANSNVSWDTINSAMNTPTLQAVTNHYQGSDDSNLPVELSSFTASSDQNYINLKWETATEVNNYGFDVERKINDDQWEKVGFVNGNGNSSSTKTYSFKDSNPIGGSKFYYRLKQIDNDGQFDYTDAVEVVCYQWSISFIKTIPIHLIQKQKLNLQFQ